MWVGQGVESHGEEEVRVGGTLLEGAKLTILGDITYSKLVYACVES